MNQVTLIIWTDISISALPRFFLVEGDYSRFHDKMINDSDTSKELTKEMDEFFYGGTGEFRFEALTSDKIDLEWVWTCQANCGFLP